MAPLPPPASRDRNSLSTFGLIDLFVLMTLAALVLGFLTPFLPILGGEISWKLAWILPVQLLVVGFFVWRQIKLRSRALTDAGARLGTAYTSQLSWRHWPLVYSLLLLSLIAIAQVAVAIWMANQETLVSFVIVQMLQIGFFSATIVTRYLWRAFPSTLEFFENGIVARGTVFSDWATCKVRPSKLYPERLAIVVSERSEDRKLLTQNTLVARPDPRLRKKLDALAIVEHSNAT